MSVDRPGASGPEVLSSNVVNYLVWRYLQEAGYDRAAAQLQRNWTGKGDGSDPDSLPFAANVRKGTLVNLVQDGLYVDHLQADVKQTAPRYYFGPDHGPKFSVPADEPRERRIMRDTSRNTSRISSAGERELQNGTSGEHAPQRAAKRKRKSAGNDRRMNGDMMDTDGSAVGPMSNVDPTVPEAESPGPMVQDEPVPIEDTLTTGHNTGVSTDKPRDLLPDTSFIAYDDQPILEHVQWSPHQPKALFISGQQFMKTYQINPSAPENYLEEKSQTTQIHAQGFEIEAFCWTEKGQATFSVRETYENEEGARMDRAKLMTFSDYGRQVQLLDPLAGQVIALRYNPDSKMVVCLSMGALMMIRAWKLTATGHEYLSHKILSHELYDIAWTSAKNFIVCGISILEIYSIDNEDINLVKSVETPHDWMRLRVDQVCNIVACLDESMQVLGIMQLDVDYKMEVRASDNGTYTSIAFQPIQNPSSRLENSPRLLATATAMGTIQFWNALDPFTSGCLFEKQMGKGYPAGDLAFSPDGFYLAAAGYNKVKVWKPEKGGDPKAVWHLAQSHERFKIRPDPVDDEAEDWYHGLTWDMDGKKIAYRLDNQIAIIRMRAALM